MQFLFILLILFSGIWLGWFYSWKFRVQPLKEQNKNLRKVEVRELGTHTGKIEARISEWPLNAEEYLEFHSLERDGGDITITYEGMETHLNCFAQHLLTRQRKDFMNICKELKNGDKIKQKLNS